MAGFVVDCSVTMGWCFEDESTNYALQVLGKLKTSHAIVPAIWPLEVANVLLVAERRKRIAPAEVTRFVALLEALPITVQESATARILDDVLSLARSTGLSSYDAAYLELAMRAGIPLASRDQALVRAAKSVGVPFLKVR